mgnify:FL=1
MKKMVAVAMASGWLAVAQTPEPAPATDVTAADIQGMLKQLPKEKITDAPIRVADVGGYRVGVFVVFRPKSNEAKERAAAHNTRVTEIYYILEGSGTLVTGGKIVGDRIDGGVTRHVAKGDVVMIPGHLPHWWSALDSDISYLRLTPDPDSQQKLR